jgi:hypothetical protein
MTDFGNLPPLPSAFHRRPADLDIDVAGGRKIRVEESR